MSYWDDPYPEGPLEPTDMDRGYAFGHRDALAGDHDAAEGYAMCAPLDWLAGYQRAWDDYGDPGAGSGHR